MAGQLRLIEETANGRSREKEQQEKENAYC